jgi:hypothetical protein
MTAATATVRSPDLPPGPDHLAGAVLNSMLRPVPGPAWGALRTFVLAILTFGLLPLILWPLRLREQVVVEQQRLWHLAEWLRLRGPEDRTRVLQQLADELRFRGASWLIIAMMLIGLGLFAAPRLAPRGSTLQTLYAQTYAYGYHHAGLGALMERTDWRAPRGTTTAAARELFLVWTAALSIGYLAHWMQVRNHSQRMRRYVEQFNVLAAQEGVAPVPLPAADHGFRGRWVALAAVMVMIGAWWGVPMALAAATQRNHLRHISPPLRYGLAGSMREMLRRQRPWMTVPMPVRLGRRCPTERCTQLLPPEAQFCPRCGTRVL